MPDNRKGSRETPRSDCYDRVRACMEQHLREYYRQHPERLMDARSVDKVEMMRRVLSCILVILDEYEICKGEQK